MADDIIDTAQGEDLASAANAIEALLNPKPVEAAPAQAAATAPETPQDSPQAAAPIAPDAGNTAPEGAQAPVVENAAPVPTPSTPDTKPVSSPELDTRLQEATRQAQEAATVRNQFVNALNTLVPQLEAQIRGEFADIKTNDDLVALADPRSPNYNPDRYNAFQAQLIRLNGHKQQLQQAQAQEAQQQASQIQQWKLAEQQKLFTAIPDLKDPEKGPVLKSKLEAFAAKNGYTPQQLAMASSNDFILLNRAMAADDLEGQLEAARAKASSAPPVQAPGTQRQTTNKEDQFNTDFGRLQKSGRVDDAAAVFKHMFPT